MIADEDPHLWGGRCNLTHESATERDFLATRPMTVRSILREFPADSMRALVEARGVPLRVEPGGKLFPAQGRGARHVLDALFEAMGAAGIATRFGRQARRVEPAAGPGWRIDRDIECRRVVIATGGMSVPSTGSTGFGYDLARSLAQLERLRP